MGKRINTGNYDAGRLKEFIQICKYWKVLSKEHNGDYLGSNLIKEKMSLMKIPESFLSRSVNEGFSGGVKKRNEILQMLLLSPKLCVLDETDSGLDVDALKIVAKGIDSMRNNNRSIILVTHYERLLKLVKPDFVLPLYTV